MVASSFSLDVLEQEGGFGTILQTPSTVPLKGAVAQEKRVPLAWCEEVRSVLGYRPLRVLSRLSLLSVIQKHL